MPSDHAAHTALSCDISCRSALDMLERHIEQCVAREDRRPFAESLMNGGSAAAQIVVVHAGQIVVNERIIVNKLDRERNAVRVFRPSARYFRAHIGERGAHAFSARADRVDDRVPDGRELDGIILERFCEQLFKALLV